MKGITSLTFISVWCVVGAVYDQKPAYHVTPEQGQWMNDPNGPMFVDGYYHLFFQCNPYGTVWGNMSWAHVISQDLVHWKRMPIAMYNDMTYDVGGVFSGSAALKDGVPSLFYTCTDEKGVQLQCVAFPDKSDDATLQKWQKSHVNPIINSMQSDWDGINFRDPTVWSLSNEDTWSMITAATNGHDTPSSVGNGIVALYTTQDGAFPYNWTYSGALWSSDNPDAAFHTWMVECPDFFPGGGALNRPSEQFVRDSGELYVLKYSIMETWQEFYEVGAYNSVSAGSSNNDSSQFARDTSYAYPYPTATSLADNVTFPGLLLDYGPNGSFYASKTFFDTPHQQRILWGWSKEMDGNVEGRDWQGVQSLPRTVQLDSDAKLLRIRPASELQALREQTLYQHQHQEHNVSTTTDGDAVVHTIPAQGLQLEILATFASSSSSSGGASCTLQQLQGYEFGILARRSEDGSQYTKYGFSVDTPASAPTSTTAGTEAAAEAVALSLVMDSTRSGGSTPSQLVRTPLPGLSTAVPAAAAAPVPSAADSSALQFSLHLFLDHSMTEMFVQDGTVAATMRIYPAQQHQGLAWYVQHREETATAACSVHLEALTVYSVGSIWSVPAAASL